MRRFMRLSSVTLSRPTDTLESERYARCLKRAGGAHDNGLPVTIDPAITAIALFSTMMHTWLRFQLTLFHAAESRNKLIAFSKIYCVQYCGLGHTWDTQKCWRLESAAR